MTTSSLLRSLLLLVIGAGAGAFVATRLAHRQAPVPVAAQTTTLQADVAHLKDIVPGQSHAMIDVGYHMANLWFAVERKNWPFAAFEVDETRNRIRWTIRINPIRKDPEGKPVDLKSIFDAIDTSSMASLKQAVEKKDSAAFGVAYRQMLESCYACHKASGKPYLRPMVPSAPQQSIMNYDPAATWPQ
jgi:cytochrome c553